MKRVLLLCCLLGLLVPGMAQQPLTGRVTSALDQSPLPGATVTLKNRPIGAQTDTAGHFTLPTASSGDTLLVSFIGFAPHQRVLSLPLSSPLEITLEAATQGLREVVVSTGYQRLPKERATGSFTQVGEAALQQQVGPTILDRLEAVANGLTVDRAGFEDQLLVRGVSTLLGPRAPLIVVDNFPYEGDIRNINPNDVESVTILKDAAAASIWGARAGNGVIVITTKKGRFDQPLTARINANVTVSPRPDLSYLRQMSASDFIDVEEFLFAQGHYDYMVGGYGQPPLSPVVELLVQKRNGTLPAAEADARIDALRQVDVRDAYDQHIYQPSVNQQYALSLQAGSQVLAWNFSAGYDRNLDVLDARYNRLNLRLDNTLRPTKELTLQLGAAYTSSESTGGRPGYGQIGQPGGGLYPYASFADAAGNPLPLVRDHQQAYTDTAGGGHLLDWNYYPLTDFAHVQDQTTLQDLTANAGLLYTWRYGLSGEVRYQYERQQTQRRLLQDADSYYARNLVNRYTQRDPETGAYTYVVPRGGILDLDEGLLASQNLRGQLNYDRSWQQHTLAMIAGLELRHARTTGHASRRYGYDAEKLSFGQVDYTVPYPEFVTGFASFVPQNNTLTDQLNRFVSQYANAAYTYGDRYTFSASARRDASNLFGLNTNEQWNPLWSAGLGWDVSKESFYQAAWLPSLRLRATYGFSGNTNPAFTAVSTLAYVATSPYTGTPYARFATYANPDLRWEKVGMWNAGLDFALKNNRVRGSLEYYRKDARDLFALFPVDYTTGVGDAAIRNAATLAGQGADLELSTLNLKGALQWQSQLNFSYSQDEVRDYYLSDPVAYQLITPGYRITGVEGKPAYAVYSYRWAGLDPQTGTPRGYVDGEVSQDYRAIRYAKHQDDLVYHGSAIPTFFGSLGNTFTWRKLSLSARVSWKLGYYFRADALNYSDLFYSWGGHADFARRWQQPGDEQHTDVPALVYPDNFMGEAFYAGSEALVEKGDHLRLQYIHAAYDLQVPGKGKGLVDNMQLYLNLSNVGILWRANTRGLDPDRYRGNALPDPMRLSLGFRATL